MNSLVKVSFLHFSFFCVKDKKYSFIILLKLLFYVATKIHLQRESALRKKHGELSRSDPTSPDTVSSNAEASLFLNEEVSGLILHKLTKIMTNNC